MTFSRSCASLHLIGSPTAINEQLAEYRAAGVTHVQLRVNFGEMPVELVDRTVNLVTDSVLGHWRSAETITRSRANIRLAVRAS